MRNLGRIEYLANALKNGDDMAKITNMENREGELEIGKMTDTIDGIKSTSFTKGALFGRSLRAIVREPGVARRGNSIQGGDRGHRSVKETYLDLCTDHDA